MQAKCKWVAQVHSVSAHADPGKAPTLAVSVNVVGPSWLLLCFSCCCNCLGCCGCCICCCFTKQPSITSSTSQVLQAKDFSSLKTTLPPHWPMCFMLMGWSRRLPFALHKSLTHSRCQLSGVRLQGNKIFCCSELRGYTYTIYLYVSMCKYIYICRVDVSISPSVTLQLFAAVLGLTHHACQTSCE